MNKKILVITIALSLLLPAFVPSALGLNTIHGVPNLNHMLYASIGEPETLDPAWAYDTASAELIQNMYEPLISLPREIAPPDTDYPLVNFAPAIAESWTITNGGMDYTFTIRSGIPFHDAAYGTVTAADVEYSIERAIVLDHVGGPTWMYYYPLFGIYTSDQSEVAKAPWLGNYTKFAQDIDNAITTSGNTVTFHLKFPFAPFMQILSQSWGAIYPKAWGVDLYEAGRSVWPGWDYPGGVGDYNHWRTFNDVAQGYSASPLQTRAGHFDPVEQGTGPFMGAQLSGDPAPGPFRKVEWVIEDHYTIARFGDYWRLWPAEGAGGFVDLVTHQLVPAWPTRRTIFLSDDPRSQSDMGDVPRANTAQMEVEPKVRVNKNLPSLILSPAGYFNFNVSSSSVYFSQKPKLGGATKLDLFSDIHMRKGFAYALDYAKYIIDAYRGEAQVSSGPILEGMSFYNASKTKYSYNLALAKAEFQAAYGGQAWSQGFTVPMTYNEGNVARQILMNMLSKAITQDITGWGTVPSLPITALPWGSIYIPAKNEGELAFYAIGWVSDYSDPDNNVVTFVHTVGGDSAKFQKIDWGGGATKITPNDFAPSSGRKIDATTWRDETGAARSSETSARVNTLVEDAGKGINRQAIYEYLTDLWYAVMPTITPTQILIRQWERQWVQGYFYNIIGSHAVGYFYYYLYKTIDSDLNNDHVVNIVDAGVLSSHWWDGSTSGLLGYSTLADISYTGRRTPETVGSPPFQTREMDGALYKTPGADGLVDVDDVTLMNAQYLDTVIPT